MIGSGRYTGNNSVSLDKTFSYRQLVVMGVEFCKDGRFVPEFYQLIFCFFVRIQHMKICANTATSEEDRDF